jgi:hypothetical protein
VKFYATKRVGGDVIEANAIKVLSHKIIIWVLLAIRMRLLPK